MRRVHLLVAATALVGVALFLAEGGFGYSDGIAGSSGAIEEQLRTCRGTQYCKVRPAYCGGCHGQFESMWTQEDAHPTPQERVEVTFLINGQGDEFWEYEPGRTYEIDVALKDTRPQGQYNSGGFDLNASAGDLSKWSDDDADVRITGGIFNHSGTKNPAYWSGDIHYGASANVSEEKWAGEATHTAAGAEKRAWRLKWTAPMEAPPPRGMAFVMTAMLPNGDGVDCAFSPCDASTPQDTWDWYGFMIPRRILCEQGHYAQRADCHQAVLAYILPPAPPAATSCEPGDVDCPILTTTGAGGGSPSLSILFTIVGLAGVVWGTRRSRLR